MFESVGFCWWRWLRDVVAALRGGSRPVACWLQPAGRLVGATPVRGPGILRAADDPARGSRQGMPVATAGHTRPTSPRRPEFDEQALLAAAQRGDLPAFNQIILHYQSLAYNVAYRILGDADAAEDVTQESFIKAFQRLKQYRGGSFKAWLLRIITNTCYDALRAHKRRPTSSLESAEDEDADHDVRWLDRSEQPDAYVMRQELANVIQAAIQQLPPDQRITLILSDIEGLDYQEIAEATHTALGTVKSRLSRARARLRTLLLAQGELLPSQYRL